MTIAEFQSEYAHNIWANDRLVSMLKNVYGEETDLRTGDDPTARHIQETAVHIIWAQAIWRGRMQQQPLTVIPIVEDYPTPLSIKFAFGAERARFALFLQGLTDADLEREIAYVNQHDRAYRNRVGDILRHVLYHSMYHRGQITGLLIQSGHEAALLPTDYIVRLRE